MSVWYSLCSDSEHGHHRLQLVPLVLDDLSRVLSPWIRICILIFCVEGLLIASIVMKSKGMAGNPLDISWGLYTATATQHYTKIHFTKNVPLQNKAALERKKNTTGKHFELFKELRKLSPNPIFSNSVTTTTKPSYMTNSVVLKSRKWQRKDILRLFHNSV